MSIERRIVGVDTQSGNPNSALYQGWLDGVLRYAGTRPSWRLLFNTPPLMQGRPFNEFRDLPGLGAEGLITRVSEGDHDPAELKGLDLAIVTGGGAGESPPGFPNVQDDTASAGALAASYYLDRGFRMMAFLGNLARPSPFSVFESFARTSMEGGATCHWLSIPGSVSGVATDDFAAASQAIAADPVHTDNISSIAHWLRSLPKPIALMVPQDSMAQPTMRACERVGASVPEDVAMMGCGDNALVCHSLQPTLSSVDQNAQRIGFEAARLLDALMDGGAAPDEPIQIPARRIIERGSTDVFAVDDRVVARALRFMRRRLSDAIGTKDVVEDSSVSLSTLERKFHAALDRTVNAELQRQRIERSKALMLETDLSVAQIAELSGFRITYFRNIFAKEVGMPPGRWREEHG